MPLTENHLLTLLIESVELREIPLPLVHFFETSFGRTTERQIVLARENNLSLSSATETGFEKVNERQGNFAQFNRLDKQSKKGFLRERHYALPAHDSAIDTEIVRLL